MNRKKYYISTAIAYASGKPHIGNTYEIVLADAIARFKRAQGFDVYFQTGTDEHGQKIELKAQEAGITPTEFTDNAAAEIKRIWDVMDTSYDKFIRTTDAAHKAQVQKIFKKLYERGDIYKSEYRGMYCTPCESFFTESQLIDGKCPDCGREVKPACEEAYFFRMSKYAPALEKYIAEHPDFIYPESRKNEMINNFLKPGLQDLCVSRTSFKWGIPVDFDDKHVIYVWIDALSNYITFLGYDCDGQSSEAYAKYWPADLHLIGKDILRFHTIYWPIILMALGEPLPHRIFGHPWLLASNDKMSKSKGNVIYADDLVKLFGVDAVRYYLLHEIPFASDGTISYALVMERINSELANILGNLVNRTIAMDQKYFGGVIQEPSHRCSDPDDELISMCEALSCNVCEKMEQLRIADALDQIFAVLRRANKYIDQTTPWILAKNPDDLPRLGTVLYNLLESIRICAVFLAPFLPGTAKKIFAQLNVPEQLQNFESARHFGMLCAGQSLGNAEILFSRIDIPKMTEQIKSMGLSDGSCPAADGVPSDSSVCKKSAESEKTAKNAKAEPVDGVASLIDIDDFCRVRLQVAEILTCEPVPKSKKLLKMTVSLGDQTRQVVSGIAKWYAPDDLIGKKAVMVTNLKPAKLCGVESCGMLLAADNSEDDVRLLFVSSDIRPGAEIH